MEYTNLGRTGLHISKLCLGTMAFGNSCDEKESFRIMDAALDAGINFFDTADNYGKSTQNEGITETIIGHWFSQGGGRRERVILNTKVHEEMHRPYDGPNSPGGLSTWKVRRHLQESLQRLRTDHVDLYFMHHIDRTTSWEEMWDVFEQLFRDGLINYAGTSNHPAWYMTMGQERANQRHFFGIAAEQHLYNLLTRQAELEVLPAAQRQGIAILAYSPLAGGQLAASGLTKLQKRKAEGTLTAEQAETLRKLDLFAEFCRDIGATQDEVATAWLVRNPLVTCPILGVRTVEMLESSIRSLEVNLTPETMAQLDTIFPSVGPAPEAYAW